MADRILGDLKLDHVAPQEERTIGSEITTPLDVSERVEAAESGGGWDSIKSPVPSQSKSLERKVAFVYASLEDRIDIASTRLEAAVYARDWTNAKEILGRSPNKEFYFSYAFAAIPRGCLEIWIARLERDKSATEARFPAARDQLNQNVEAHPEDAELLSVLGIIDAFMGRKNEAIKEATRATEMLPISEDAESGPSLVSNLAVVYTWTNEPDLAFKNLDISVRTPAGIL
jgi:tetratricopeptide (TPR) repeat protein